MNKRWPILLASILLFSNCSTKNIPLFRNNLEKEKQQVWKKIEQNEKDFRFMAAKGKAKINNGSSEISLSINFRIKKDSIIWASITALAGIEVARAYITPDSIKVLDRINNRYLRNSFSYLNELANADLDFSMLQAALTSKRPAFIDEKTSKFSMDSSDYLFTGLLRELEYIYQINTKFRPAKLSFSDTELDQKVEISYSEYGSKSSPDIPQHIVIKTKSGKDKFEMDIQYNKVTVDEPLDFPFSIPKKFE